MPKRIEYKEGELIGECIFLENLPNMGKHRFALFQCPICGTHFESRIDDVKSCKTVSCGCYGRSRSVEANTKHGLCDSSLYSTWLNMRDRCDNPKNKDYHRYGGRGITVCDTWRNDFRAFYNHVTSLPNYLIRHKGYTLDRENNDEGYRPGNVRWADRHTQAANKDHYVGVSGYSGVTLNGVKFETSIVIDSIRVYIGLYNTKKEAAMARNKYIKDNKLNRKIQEL